MEKHQLKGLCYNCDENYSPRHKCKKQKLFMAISDEEVDGRIQEEVTPITKEVPLLSKTGEEPQISLHA